MLFEGLYFFLPAGIANIVPPLFSKLNLLNKPLDFGLNLGGKRIFGEHKTWRGLIFGILLAMVVISIQRIIGWNLSFFSYEKTNFLLVGALLGLGALLGDAIKSFFKRRCDVKPGGSWFPFDQIDYILGGLLFVSFYILISFKLFLIILVEYFLLHLVINYIGYLIKIKQTKI